MEGTLELFVAWVRQNPGATLILAAGAYLSLLLPLIIVLLRFSKMNRKQSRLLRGADGGGLEQMLLEHGDYREAAERRIGQAIQTGDANAATIQQCFQRIGLVRYDAFDNVGGEQSFSLALLDANNNGMVFTGLHSRHDSRIYAKPIIGGDSTLTLTAEERQAIVGAKAGGPTLQRSERGVAGSRR